MHNRLIFLTVLALMMVGTAFCELSEVTKIPASQDVYFGIDKEGVYNTDILRCEINVSDENGSRTSSYSGVPMIQFNISGLKMTEDDIGILVLKAASVGERNELAMIAMMPVGSDWSENSSYLNLFFNLRPVIDVVESNDITKMGISTGGDKIIAFDVSKKLLDAKSSGNLVSFMLMAISNSSYRVDFKSRETGEGPYLIVMPYPSEIKAGNLISLPSNKSAINNSAINKTAINNSLINRTAINNSAINRTAINNSLINRTAINNSLINRTATNKNVINQTAIQPNKSVINNSNISAEMPINKTAGNQTMARVEMMNATKENNTEKSSGAKIA